MAPERMNINPMEFNQLHPLRRKLFSDPWVSIWSDLKYSPTEEGRLEQITEAKKTFE